MATDLISRLMGALFPQYQMVRYFDAHLDRIHHRQMNKAEWKCYYHFKRKRRRMLLQDEEEYLAWVKRNL